MTKPKVAVITAKTVRERYDRGLKATMFERRDYWLNYAFLRGRQWIYWNKQTRRIDDLARYNGRYQATIDRLAPSSRTIMSKLTERQLSFEVSPTGSDDDSILGARTGEAVLRNVHREHDWEVLREDLAWAVWTGGTAAICVDWDAYAGEEISSGDEDSDPIHVGDICETVLTIPEFVVEPGSRRAETARWWIKSVILPPETVQSMYPDAFAKQPPPSDAESSSSPYNQRMAMTDDQAINVVDGTLVLTYYERPNSLNPKGSQTVVVDNKIVDQKDWPFPFNDRLNLAVIRETPVNGRWTGETVLSKARSVQTALNAAWSNYLEHLKKAGNARLMVPASQMEAADTLTDDPGRPLKFLDGPGAVLPKYLDPPNLPPWVREIIGELRGEMDTILGMSDVARGMAPSNAPDSGYGFQILNENTNTPVGRLSKEMARAFGRIGSIVLKLYEDNVESTHHAVVQAPRQIPMTIAWTGKDLAGQTTVVVPLDAIRPRSQAASQQLADHMLQSGMITPGPGAATMYARIAELPGAEDLISIVDEQVALAQRYCHYMAEGQMIVPKTWHDSTVMIAEINRFRCTPRYESLKPDLQELFEIAVQGYDTLAKEQAGQRVAEQMMSPMLAATPDKNGAPPLPLPPTDDLGSGPVPVGAQSEPLPAPVEPQLPLGG